MDNKNAIKEMFDYRARSFIETHVGPLLHREDRQEYIEYLINLLVPLLQTVREYTFAEATLVVKGFVDVEPLVRAVKMLEKMK